MAIAPVLPYETLYAEHGPAARRLARTLVPHSVADDIVAEAWAKLLAAGTRPELFRPYLLAAVRNTARSWHARGRRLVPVGLPEPAPVPSPERIAIEREDARLALAAFARLPQRWQAVLWATAVEEIPAQELAQRWDMAPNAVSQLASRAREGLRQAYLSEHLGTSLAPACRAVAPYMGAAVRGRASRRHQAELQAHLAGCAGCRRAYAGLGDLNSRLGELLLPVAAAGSALARTLRPAGRATGRSLHLHAGAATAGTVAALAVAGTLVFTVPSHGTVRGQAATPAPAWAATAQVSARGKAGYAPRHARVTHPGTSPAAPGLAIGLIGTAGLALPTVAPVTSAAQAAGATVTGAGQAAGQAVSAAGQAAGGTASQLGRVAGRMASTAAGTAGRAVTGVTGQAGRLVPPAGGL